MLARKDFFKKKLPKYRNDITMFAREVLQFEPDEWQKEVFKDTAENGRVSVKSGQGVGKTGCEAIILLWFLCCFPFPRIVATAPTRQQLNDVLWSEVAKWQSKSPVLNQILKWTKTYIYMTGYEKRWFAVARTATKPENMQGFHEDNMLFIVDEASGVADPIMEAILGTLSGKNNKLVMCGNPTRTSGVFYDSHTKDRSMYRCHTVNSEDSPRTNKENIAALKRKYGKDSNVVRVRVYGEFPLQEDDVFIQLSLLEAAIKNELDNVNIPVIKIGVDVARFGGDETVLAVNAGGQFRPFVRRKGNDTTQTTGDVIKTATAERQRLGDICNVIVIVDDTGIGGGVTDQLRYQKQEQGLDWLYIIPVNAAQSANSAYYNDITTALWAVFRDLLEEGQLSLPDDNDMVGQFSIRKFKIKPNGKIQLESKKEMKARGIYSPDIADASVLACYPINYEKLFNKGRRKRNI